MAAVTDGIGNPETTDGSRARARVPKRAGRGRGEADVVGDDII